jgi:hypothetical protein
MSDSVRSIQEVPENPAGKLPARLAANLWAEIEKVKPCPDHDVDGYTRKMEIQKKELAAVKPIQESWHNKGLPAERAHLNELLKHNFSKDDLSMLHDRLQQFETRAWAASLSKGEIAQTYSEISRIITAGGTAPVSPELRKQIVRETIRHCAEPEVISQGGHNTCNVTAVEVRTYSLHPAKAAKLVADIATTGEYTTRKGIKVKLDRESMEPDIEALHSSPFLGERDYSTQLFNLAAVNVWYSAVKPSTRYEQRLKIVNGNQSVEERITDYSHHRSQPVLNPYSHKPLSDPYLSADQIAFISDAIVGKHEPFAVLAIDEKSTHLPGAKKQSTRAAEVFDESNLNVILQKLKDEHQLPAIAAVDTNVDPLNTDSGSGIYGPGGGHVINVTDFKGGKMPRVSMDNEWSPKEDHPNRSVDMHALYLCMGGSDVARLDAYANAQEARAKGKVAPAEEISQIRFDGQKGYLENYTKEAIDAIKDLSASERKLQGDERIKWFRSLQTIVNTVANADKVTVLKSIRAANVCSNAEFGQLLAGAVKSISFNKQNAIASGNNTEKRICINATTKAAEYLCTLPAEIKKHYFTEMRGE